MRHIFAQIKIHGFSISSVTFCDKRHFLASRKLMRIVNFVFVTYNFNIILKVHIQSTVVAYGCYHCGLCYLLQMPLIFPSLNISNIVITNLVRDDDHRGTFPQVVSYLWKQSKLFWKSRAAKTKIIRVLTILIKV